MIIMTSSIKLRYWSYFLRLFTIFLAVFLFANFSVTSVFADPLPDSELVALSGYPNWVADACGSGSSSDQTANNNLYLLGDSILEGAYYETQYLKKALDGNNWNSSADASSGRGLTTPGVDSGNNRPGNNQSGLDAINTDKSTIQSAGVVVIGLGTNASNSNAAFKNEMEKAVSNITSINQNAQIYLINLFSGGRQVNAYNNIIKQIVADKHLKGAIDTSSLSQRSLLSSDGVHPNNTGYKKYSDIVSNAIGNPASAPGGGVKGGVQFDDSHAHDHAQTDIDTDGSGSTKLGGDQTETNMHSKGTPLNGDKVNWYVLRTGWADANGGIKLGDLAALTYKGKTVYAIFGDNNGTGSEIHSEISVAAAKALGGTGHTSLTGVKTTVYPGTHKLLNVKPDSTGYANTDIPMDQLQAKIDQVGAQVSGGVAPASGGASGQCCPSSGNASFGPGTLPNYVKEPYNKIFTAAAAKYNVNPAVLVALFYNEQYGYQNAVSSFKQHIWPNPPPPYGSGASWTTSSAVARGPFQFIPSTWSAGAVDGNGDGKADPNDLTDAAFAAAKGASNGLFGGVRLTASSSPDQVAKMASYYYGDKITPPGSYGAVAAEIYKQVVSDETGPGGAGSPGTTVSAGAGSAGCPSSATTGSISAYKDPLRDVRGLLRHRVDEGVDYCGAGPVYAVGNGKVTYVGSGWFSSYGPSVVYKLSDGPAAGKYIFFAEKITPKVKVGDPVTSDTVIANMHAGDPCIETGWALGPNFDEPAAGPEYHNYANGTAMAYGRNFSAFMKAIGSHTGDLNRSTNPSVVGGSLAPGWPTKW